MKRSDRNRTTGNSIGRALFAAIALGLQIYWIVALATYASTFSRYISIAVDALVFFLVVFIHGGKHSSASKYLWMVLIMLFPLLGLCLYLLAGQPWATRSMQKRFENISRDLSERLPQDENLLSRIEEEDISIHRQMHYIQRFNKYPVYENTQVEFHPETDMAFARLKAELKKARKFIFMEYHAIELSACFMEIEEILTERASAGVEVRIFYDDIGSLSFIEPRFVKRMEARGIRCRVFNPIMPFISAFMNNRDHRKITVIDGKVAFTGGYNLADEYFNVKSPYGHWKDTGIMLTGDAVVSMTVMFLEMWNAVKKYDRDYSRYTARPKEIRPSDGYVQPYADSPLDDERTGEAVYMNILKNALHYCWIATPYLILDEEMRSELALAAKRGVDVRIFTPGIPDKKLVYRLTRSYYPDLLKAGVRIFEYTPGFLHAKQMVSDDTTAVVGTINLDYRSLYMHFENAVLMYKCAAVRDIRADFETMQPKCREITKDQAAKHPFIKRTVDKFLRLFSPLL